MSMCTASLLSLLSSIRPEAEQCYTCRRQALAYWMLQIPNATSFIGSIGKDKYGDEMKKNSNRHELMCTIMKMKLQQLVLVEFVLLAMGVTINNSIETVKKAKYVYIAGFFLLVSPESVQLVAQHATSTNRVFIMNLSAPFICEFFKDAQDKALRYVDYVFGNETEARMFSKVHGWNVSKLNSDDKIFRIVESPIM
ncbi:hypothetical protein L2E82_19773 [Cichorium intybus]|uniref:Uncharacterized protein n=1 Tax=Cichorium intybus TaxID=13427 RepID=A0ACB9DRU8_CICIN|nr:hypothetical protein L2E82_19773 [Cichorium intybus]